MQDYKKLAQNQIALGKSIAKVQKSLDAHYKQEHKLAFHKAVSDEYDVLFPLTEIVQVEEVQEDESVILVDTEEVTIDYTDAVGYMTLQEYIDEVVVTTAYVEPTYELDGVTILTEEVLEVTELVRPYVAQLQADVDILVNADTNLVTYQATKINEAKDEALGSLEITHNTVAYDANGRSVGNMGAVNGIANYKFNRYTSIGVALDPLAPLALTVLDNATAYQAIYKDTKVFWKGADNVLHEVMVESICEVLESVMTEIGAIYAGSVV